MANKIFVSYKYRDVMVQGLPGKFLTTARDYVDALQIPLQQYGHIYKGENDNESLGSLADATIGSKLGDKIFDSSVTLVLVSKGMKGSSPERDQWMPWEISYSLKEQSRAGGRSRTNAVIAIILPDEFGSYSYYITENAACNSITLNTNFLFQILKDNMFNRKDKHILARECNGNLIYNGDHSYIQSVKWNDFISRPQAYIDKGIDLRDNISMFDVVKNVK